MGDVKLVNRPLPSSKNPHFQNEARCSNFFVKMSFICMRMKKWFPYQRLSTYPRFETEARGTRKWPNCLRFSQGKFSFQGLSSICPKKWRELENEAGFRKKSSQIHKSPEVTGVIRISRALNQDLLGVEWVGCTKIEVLLTEVCRSDPFQEYVKEQLFRVSRNRSQNDI